MTRFSESLILILLLSGVVLAGNPLWGDPPGGTPLLGSTVLDYRSRYDCQTGEPDHLMSAAGLTDGRALVAGNRGLALLDLGALPVEGTREYLFRLTGVNARDIYLTPNEDYVFVNTHRGEGTGSLGFEVVRLAGNTLTKVTGREEDGVLYEKMCLSGDYLFVAAHSKGLRVFDITDPEDPQPLGRLEEGFVDAFAVAIDGTTAYVADGAGGLKIVDVTDPSAPEMIDGETLETALGTSEDVTVKDGRVYVAAGGAGLAAYEGPDLSSRSLVRIGGAAESLCWVGEHLAVGTIHAAVLCEIGEGTLVSPVAVETAHRRGSGTLRLRNSVAAAPGNLLLCSDWNSMDVYEVVDAASSTQADIECDTQRIRFPHEGGSQTVTIWNSGGAPLEISSASSSDTRFDVDYSGGTLPPGESVSFEVTHAGSISSVAEGVVTLTSNDPDESRLPIQVFGNTSRLDPGESAPDFTLPTISCDPATGELTHGSFTLSENRGKVVWYSIFATW